MDNVISSCRKHAAKLVFFDNVYAYGKVDGWMTEDTAYHPTSKKGQVRAQIADKLMNAVDKGELTAIIARAADFYGKTPLSIVSLLVFDNYAKGGKAQCVIDDSRRHSYTYIPDAGKATALLGNTPDAFNQVWHLPTDRSALTGRSFIEEAARAFGVEAKYTVLRKWMITMAGLFNPVVRESIEMLYQNEHDYLFSSEKFESALDMKPTSYVRGIEETVELYRQSP
jgi:nucleoside-diphosphate-sugar epimerase